MTINLWWEGLILTKAKCLTPKSTFRASFSLAGFQVTLIGRFRVTPEDLDDTEAIFFILLTKILPFVVQSQLACATNRCTWGRRAYGCLRILSYLFCRKNCKIGLLGRWKYLDVSEL